MNGVVVADLDGMSREDWLALRRKGIGGSDAPAVFGVSPFASPITVYLDKLGQGPEVEETEMMRWGRKLEAVIAEGFEEKHPELHVVDCQKLYAHPDLPWMIATPDRLLANDHGVIVAGLEIKNVGQWSADGWMSDDDEDMPAHVLVQGHHYATVLDLPWFAAGLTGGNQLRVKAIPRDHEFSDRLIDVESEFWSMVERCEPPPVDGHAATTRAIAAMYADADPDKIVDLDDEALGALRSLREAKAVVKAAEAEVVEHANRLKSFLGDASVGMVGDRVAVTWNQQTVDRLDQNLLASEYPDVFQACRIQTSHRTLLTKKGEF